MAYFNISNSRKFDTLGNSCFFPVFEDEVGKTYYLEFSEKADIRVLSDGENTTIALHLAPGLIDQFDACAASSWTELCGLLNDNMCSSLLFSFSEQQKQLKIYYPATAYQKLYYSASGQGAGNVAKNSEHGVQLASRINLLNVEHETNSKYDFFFLSYQFYPFGQAIFKNVREFDKHGTWIVNANQICHDHAPEVTPARTTSIVPAEAEDYLYERMIEVLKKQTLGVDHVAVMLGGFDSALIVSLLHRMGKKVTAYTFAYDDAKFQQKNTEFIDGLHGVEHRWVKIQSDLLSGGIREYAEYFSVPVTQPQYLIHTKAMAEIIQKDGFTVCLTGDGCDGAFYGYPTVLKKAKFLKAISILPTFILRCGYYLLASKNLEKILGQPQRLLRGIFGFLVSENRNQSFLSSRTMDEVSFSRMFPDQMVPDINPIVYEIAAPFADMDYFQQVYAGKNYVGLNKAKLAACQNITGMDIRSPYMDSAISSISKAFPVEYWLGESDEVGKKAKSSTSENSSTAGSGGKALLSKMALNKALLPESVVMQSKMSPVSSPTDEWFRGPLREELMRYLSELPYPIDKSYVDTFFQPKIIEQMYKRRVTIDSFSMQIIALLATYSRFFNDKI